MPKGKKYGITVTTKRDLTKAEAAVVSKTLDLAHAALKLHFKDDVISTLPNKPTPPKAQ